MLAYANEKVQDDLEGSVVQVIRLSVFASQLLMEVRLLPSHRE